MMARRLLILPHALMTALVCAGSALALPADEFFEREIARTTSVQQRAEESPSSAGMEIIPQASIVMPFSLVLRGNDFEVPYSETFTGGVPSFSLGVASPLATLGQFELSWLARAGYGQKEGTFAAIREGAATAPQKLSLSWVPLSVGARALYEIPGAPFVNPTLVAGVGAFWISQRSSLGGLDANFFIPYVFIGPGVTFFEGRNANDWFGGATFGTSFFRSISNSQTAHGVSFDMSVSILL